ncbi:MAG: hypothetical protein SFX18_02435 [Pirellulales bacterium]|nr:hypothetical protein [Pirellulales bacterium]
MQPIYLGTRKGLFQLLPDGDRWRIHKFWFPGEHVSMLVSDPRDGALYAALNLGHFGVKLHRSRDGGESWQEVAAPAYPPKPEGYEELDMWGKPLPWSTQMIWALEPGPAEKPGELWCGTLPGGLFHSTDAGDSWQIVESLWYLPERRQWMGGGADYPGIHSICLHPHHPSSLIIGVSSGGAWQTNDAAQTWAVRSQGMRAEFLPPEQQYNPITQDPHLIVRCPAEPHKLWAQHHNGIFRSVDEGASWTEITNAVPSVFGFAVAVHPRHGDTAWFVPGVKDEQRIPVGGKLVVSRTRDGGESFEVLTRGLPQEHAYDIVYRHALAIDGTGRNLVLGTTTGSVYTTRDEGESWQCVSEHLPPVYCVKFG